MAAKFLNSLLDTGLKPTPNLSRAEFDWVMIGNHRQAQMIRSPKIYPITPMIVGIETIGPTSLPPLMAIS
jgi:hypothetical protein